MPQTCQAYYSQVHSSSGNLLCHMDFEVNDFYDVCHNLGQSSWLEMVSQHGGLLVVVSQYHGLLESGFPSCLLRLIDIFPSSKASKFYAGVEHCGRTFEYRSNSELLIGQSEVSISARVLKTSVGVNYQCVLEELYAATIDLSRIQDSVNAIIQVNKCSFI